MKTPEIGGLYAITPDLMDTDALLSRTQQAIVGGARIVQYRNKLAHRSVLIEQARLLLQLCRDYQVPLIINDYVDMAADIDADGVHLGQDDTKINDAKKLLGQNKIIGVSCYNRLDLAIRAEREGASYVAFGACFPSLTKPDAVPVTLDIMDQASQSISIPMVAIGGIRLTNAKPLIENGCAAIAVCNELFFAKEIACTAAQFAQMFDETYSERINTF
ncbi:thiamine phosphate synthase [Nitrosomonas sp. JL21]|uniref:thiamine phosphate synthase n=1 Tax=Nitrosomonas sp. JL21 TaxID=153949 RepID=UPI001369DA07|nr:thiamine phosphate synthase [Nitrosomonas sp. JL21]MBL8498800.1 thiamine phosphate synthase [Nitrosomonas sp.]MXS78031.1 thiamine phosphate synthase [Nitrosomonas sp. JL21]